MIVGLRDCMVSFHDMLLYIYKMYIYVQQAEHHYCERIMFLTLFKKS